MATAGRDHLKFKHQAKLRSSRLLRNIDVDTKELEETSDEEFYYEFYESDTYLNSIFPPEISSILFKFIHSSLTQICIIITFIIYMFLNTMKPDTFLYSIYTIFVNTIFWIPYAIFWMMSLNRVALNLVHRTFEYWFKVGYAIILGIAGLADDFYFHWNTFEYPILSFISRSLMSVVVIFLAAGISSVDAVHSAKKWKIILTVMEAIIFTLFSIFYQMEFYQQDQQYVIKIVNNFQISFLQITIDSMRILAIFFWKQAIQIIRNKGARCNLLKYSPFIKWKSDENNEKADESSNIDRKNNIDKNSDVFGTQMSTSNVHTKRNLFKNEINQKEQEDSLNLSLSISNHL